MIVGRVFKCIVGGIVKLAGEKAGFPEVSTYHHALEHASFASVSTPGEPLM
jgi:hypothetical protein